MGLSSRGPDSADDRDILDISAHGGLVCAVRRDHSVWCWGKSYAFTFHGNSWRQYNRPTRIADVPRARRVFVGPAGLCLTPMKGGLHCVGEPWLQAMSRPLVAALPTRAAPGHVVIAEKYACALHDAEVWCWSNPEREGARWWLGRAGQTNGGPSGEPSGELSSGQTSGGLLDDDVDGRRGMARKVPDIPAATTLVGDAHRLCVTDAADDVWCWGRVLRLRELGLDPEYDPVTPRDVGRLDKAGELVLSAKHLVLREGDSVSAYSHFGSSGIEYDFDRPVTAIRAADGRSIGRSTIPLLVYALTANGRIAVSDGDRPARVLPMLRGVRKLVGGGDELHTVMCAVDEDNRVFCWPGNLIPTDETPYPDDMYVLDARLHLGWVSMPPLQPTRPVPAPPAPPPEPPDAEADAIVALDVNNYQRACAVRGDGRAFCWIIGMGDKARWLPAKPGPALIDIVVSYEDVCAVARAGSVHCWRIDRRKGLEFEPWQKLDLQGAKTIRHWGGTFCVLHTNGRVSCFAEVDDDSGAQFRARTWAVASIRGARDISVRNDGVCGLLADGEIHCAHKWYGALQLRAPVSLQRLVTAVEMLDRKDGKRRHSLTGPPYWPVVALALDGTLWHAALHDTALTRASEVAKPWPESSLRWHRIHYTRFFGCGVVTDGTIQCWGRNDDGQLGRGSISKRELTPAPVPNLAAMKKLEVHTGGACATDGTRIWCWGASSWHRVLSPEPTRVAIDVPVVDFDLHGHSAAAVDRNGTLWAWGVQQVWTGLGIRSHNANPSAVPISGLAAEIRLAEGLACVLHRDRKTVECWVRRLAQPSRVSLRRRIKEWAVGGQGVCARLVTGRIWCWYMPQSRLFAPDPQQIGIPRQVVGVRAARTMTLGDSQGCALDRSKVVRCWPMTRYSLLGKRGPVAWSVAGVKADAVSVSGTQLRITVGTERMNADLAFMLLCPPGQRRCSIGKSVDLCDRYGTNRMKLRPCRQLASTPVTRATALLGVEQIEKVGRHASAPVTEPIDGLPAAVVTRKYVLPGKPEHWCALLADDTLYCAGDNRTGRLGNGRGGVRPNPVLVPRPAP